MTLPANSNRCVSYQSSKTRLVFLYIVGQIFLLLCIPDFDWRKDNVNFTLLVASYF